MIRTTILMIFINIINYKNYSKNDKNFKIKFFIETTTIKIQILKIPTHPQIKLSIIHLIHLICKIIIL